MTQEFHDRIEKYLRSRLAWRGSGVVDARRLAGGISRETWQVEVDTGGSDGGAGMRTVILRIDPVTTLLESNRDLECAMYRAFRGTPGVPVPEVICNEPDPAYLGASFMAVTALPGVAEISAVMRPPFAAVGRQIARAHFTVLGRIAALDYRELPLQQVLEAPTAQSAALDTLTHWEQVWREHSLGPAPITAAAIRHLKRHLPPPATIAVVHGDFRLGNCLYLADGTISGVLDWEMAHLGDPLEDLAWAMHHMWRPGAAPQHLVAGYLTEDEAIGAWEEASGRQADRAALQWWRLFTCVKAVAIFTSGGYNFLKVKDGDLVYALSAWTALDSEEAGMLRWMGVRA